MAQSTFSVRMDKELKKQLDEICFELGMTASTAINIFAREVVKERKIPFEIKTNDEKFSKDRVIEVMKEMRDSATKNEIADMTLDEINAEIYAVRRGEKE